MNNIKPFKPKPKHIVIIAGEASGDLHAASLVNTLRSHNKNLTFSGIGGNHMREASVELISDLARYGVTGLTEVIKHLKVIKRAYRDIQAHLKKIMPDLLILVDYPGFNLRLAHYAKKTLGLEIIYYISPQLWAWKPGRINKIQASVDHMAVIFPFEKKIYENVGVDVSYVGHPLTEKLPVTKAPPTHAELNLPKNKRLLAVLPGSRINEIERHLPVLFKTAKRLIKDIPDLHCVIPVANTLTLAQIEALWDVTELPTTLIEHQKATHVANLCDAIVVASGTASLECALLEKPMCIVYKVGLITEIVASIFLRIQYVGLCNVLTERMTVPELLQYDFNPIELARVLTELLDKTNPSKLKTSIVERLSTLKKSLSAEKADTTLADLVLNTLAQEKKLAGQS